MHNDQHPTVPVYTSCPTCRCLHGVFDPCPRCAQEVRRPWGTLACWAGLCLASLLLWVALVRGLWWVLGW